MFNQAISSNSPDDIIDGVIGEYYFHLQAGADLRRSYLDAVRLELGTMSGQDDPGQQSTPAD